MWALVLFFISAFSFANERSLDFQVKAKDGDSLKVRAFYYTNEQGGPEVRLESASLPRINKRINSIYGYGRDLDDDGLVETWFMIDPMNGFEIITEKCINTNCGNAINNRIFANFTKSRKAMFYSAYASLVGYLFMSLDNRYTKEIDFYRQWVNLEEFRIRLDREMNSASPSLTPDQLRAGYEALMFGYQENQKMLDKARGSQAWILLGADVGLWVSGTLVFRGLQLVSTRLVATAVFKNFQIFLNRFISAQTQYISTHLARIKWLRFSGAAIALGGARYTQQMFKKTFSGGMHALTARGRVAAKLAPIKDKLMIPIRAGLSQWKYILLNAGIQISSETFANYDEVKDPNPAKMAQNVLNHPDIQQNVSYMASETILMSAAVASLKTVKARFAVCGMIALTNSTATNYFMRDNVNPERVMMDTGWEMVIGAAQVQLDIAALTYFEKLATKKNNPKLKLLGYAVVLVDQGFGYYVYAKATEKLDQREAAKKRELEKRDEINLVPIFVEAG